jgi:hypothetical protein
MSVPTGVYPVFDLVFKIGINGRASTTEDMVEIKDMETFSPSVDGNVEEWTPMDTEGWIRRLMTGKGFAISLSGKRHVGDPGNDYIAGMAWKSGLQCSSKAEIEFPDGDKLAFDCIVNVSTPFGGDSTNVSGLEFELQSDGKPTYTPADGALGELTFVCSAGTSKGTQVKAVVPILEGTNTYMYKINGHLPALDEDVTDKGWAAYTLGTDIDTTAGNIISIMSSSTAMSPVLSSLTF